jgi:enhancing lycopene biosynthesis protein 2
MVRVGIVLSGCGYLDGAEIHEAVLAGYFLEKEGAELAWCAPDIEQQHVVNHLTGAEAKGERRNVLAESARIARGDIVAVGKLKVAAIDALVLPGGYGAAKNLCDFAGRGQQCSVHPGVETLVRAVHAAHKPIGAICIAPVLVARLLGPEGPELTIGDDKNTARALEAMGARHQAKAVHELVIDRKLKLVSTPAYMLGPHITDVARGIEALCREIVAMARTPQAVG